MALKDWKKVETGTWVGSEEFVKVDKIEYDSYYSTHQFSRGDMYMVVISQKSWPMSVTSRNGFKTKSQALAYAKAYMRTH